MARKIFFPEIQPSQILDRRVSVRFTQDQYEKLETFSKKYQVRKNDLFRYLLENFLKRYNNLNDGTKSRRTAG
jgi:metal-responsive CopG/Arc/MetJ family transcriptional regulator